MRTCEILCAFVMLCCCQGAPSGRTGNAGECRVPDAREKRAQMRWEALSPRLKSILKNLGEANQKVKTIKASVRYARAIPILDEKEQSSGSLLFKKPDRMVLKLGEPRNQDAYSDGDNWWVVDHEDRQVEIYRVARSSEKSQEAAFLQFAYGRPARELVADYDVSLVKKATVTRKVATAEADTEEKEFTEYTLQFVPATDQAPARYSAVEIRVTNWRWLPHHITLQESDGEIVHEFELKGLELNLKVKDEVFQYEPPEGYRIVRPGNL